MMKVSGREKQPKHFGRDILGHQGPDVGISRTKLYASGLFLLFFLDSEWPGCPGTWVGTSRIWKNFMHESFGLFRSLKLTNQLEIYEILRQAEGKMGHDLHPSRL